MNAKERFQADDRGVSEVIGAILVFGLLVLLMAILQTQAVPAANQEVEFNHNQEVQGDLAKFHERASRVAIHGSKESVSIQAGTGYPSRMLFFNPPRVSGTISTSEPGTAKLNNVKAADPEVADYLDGTPVSVESRTFEYAVDYNHYQDAPTTRYEYGILYNEFQDSTIVSNSGSVIDDTDINLVFMAGDYSKTSGTGQSLDVRPVSAPARPVTVESNDGGPIELVLPTDLSVAKWKEHYEGQDTVNEIREGPTDGTVLIELDGSERYTLRMAGLGLEQGVPKPEAHYIVPADDGTTSVGVGQTTNVKFEVRDRYNNPVSGAEVTVTRPDGTQVTVKTNGDGRVAVPVTLDDGGTVPVDAELGSGNCQSTTDPRCDATFTLQVSDLSINPGTGVRHTGATVRDVSFLGLFPSNTNVLDATFKTTQSGETRSIQALRVNHYSGTEDSPERIDLYNEGDDLENDQPVVEGIDVGGPFYDSSDSNWNRDPATITSSGTTYTLVLEQSDGSARSAEDTDFMVLTLVFDNGERAVYFVSPD